MYICAKVNQDMYVRGVIVPGPLIFNLRIRYVSIYEYPNQIYKMDNTYHIISKDCL